MSTIPTIVHFEIPVDNVERAQNFYQKLFGWQIKKYDGPLDYYMISTSSDKDEKTLPGGMMLRQAPNQTITNYIGVDAIDDYIAELKTLGGVVVVPKTPVTGVGYFAIGQDTEGNSFGLWETDENAAALPEFKDPAEVFVALLLSVITADNQYSVDEMRMIWYEIESLPIFKDKDFKQLETDVFKAFGKKMSEPTPFRTSEIDWTIQCANRLLTVEQCQEAIKVAEKLAQADRNIEGYQKDMDNREADILNKIKDGLKQA